MKTPQQIAERAERAAADKAKRAAALAPGAPAMTEAEYKSGPENKGEFMDSFGVAKSVSREIYTSVGLPMGPEGYPFGEVLAKESAIKVAVRACKTCQLALTASRQRDVETAQWRARKEESIRAWTVERRTTRSRVSLGDGILTVIDSDSHLHTYEISTCRYLGSRDLGGGGGAGYGFNQ